MEDNNKFQEAQQQVGTLYQAAQSALLPARDHQVVADSARSLATFLQEIEKGSQGGGAANIAMPEEASN